MVITLIKRVVHGPSGDHTLKNYCRVITWPIRKPSGWGGGGFPMTACYLSPDRTEPRCLSHQHPTCRFWPNSENMKGGGGRRGSDIGIKSGSGWDTTRSWVGHDPMLSSHPAFDWLETCRFWLNFENRGMGDWDESIRTTSCREGPSTFPTTESNWHETIRRSFCLPTETRRPRPESIRFNPRRHCAKPTQPKETCRFCSENGGKGEGKVRQLPPQSGSSAQTGLHTYRWCTKRV